MATALLARLYDRILAGILSSAVNPTTTETDKGERFKETQMVGVSGSKAAHGR